MEFGFNDAGLPWTDARLYPLFPHAYRNVEDIVVNFEAASDAVQPFLPRDVEPEGEIVACQAKFRWTPFSVHGPYHEAYVSATVRFRDARYRFLLLAYTDNDSPLVAGRELWGTPKKLARMTRSWANLDSGFSEHLVATLERPQAMRLMTIGLVCDRVILPPAKPSLPTLLLKLVPRADGSGPEIAQLIRLHGSVDFVKAADGSALLFEGRPSLSFDAMSTVDPLYRLRPLRLTGGTFARVDFAHGPGEVIHDYLRE
jgi:acetoacetate decarboxylase